jgi:CheY-like chemotaxis protein
MGDHETEPHRHQLMSAANILVVDADPVVSSAVQSRLTAGGCEVVTVASGAAALQAAAARRPDLMILDLTLDGEPSDAMRDGFALLGWLRFRLPDPSFPVIIHTVDDSAKVKERARAEGVYAVVVKTRDMTALLDTVQQALQAFGTLSSS